MRFPLACFLLAFLPVTLRAQGIEAIKADYTKFEYRIPMRDGKKLFTAVYVPKDESKKYPILLNRTPYSVKPYGVDHYKTDLGPSPLFGKAGYIFVYQDVRGRWMSEGEFVNVRPHIADKKATDVDESSDTFDTIDWLLKNVPNHNGKVGQWGISYPGFYTVCGMIDAHPALKAASPQAPVTDWFIGDDFHHNGTLFLPHFFNFMVRFGYPRPEPTKKDLPRFDHDSTDGYDYFLKLGPVANADAKIFKGNIAFWNDVMKHPNYDEFWQARNIRAHIKNIKPAVLTVGGWFDAENLFGAIETFKHAEKNQPGAANHLIMGPWSHGSWSRDEGKSLGNLQFNAKTAVYFREKIEFPFFEQHLKEKGDANLLKAVVFETGTNRWRKFDAWPPKESREQALYFDGGGKLASAARSASAQAEFDEYISDPAKPVPNIEKIDIGMTGDYMTADQRFASRRPDVLVYQGPELTEDLTLAGPIEVELYVTTTGTDADFIVKLIDVFPADYPDPNPNPTGLKMGGYQMLVRGEPFRGKYRNSFEKPEAFKPGETARIKFTMPDACHTFRPGHKIMVQVQSTWFPIVDRNPQKFLDIYKAEDKDFQKATHRVMRSSEAPSKVTIRVLP
ncbi:MAG: CocE/NonD family hydrolase [Planctomycetes bacterium]|nr:CocE/NonD family hydrolase [Planctomycetota bacterium]